MVWGIAPLRRRRRRTAAAWIPTWEGKERRRGRRRSSWTYCAGTYVESFVLISMTDP